MASTCRLTVDPIVLLKYSWSLMAAIFVARRPRKSSAWSIKTSWLEKLRTFATCLKSMENRNRICQQNIHYRKRMTTTQQRTRYPWRVPRGHDLPTVLVTGRRTKLRSYRQTVKAANTAGCEPTRWARDAQYLKDLSLVPRKISPQPSTTYFLHRETKTDSEPRITSLHCRGQPAVIEEDS